MTTRSIPAKPENYTAKSGVTYRARSGLEARYMAYLDRFVPAEPWWYEPTFFRDSTAATRIDFCNLLPTCRIWTELKPAGFLDWSTKDVDTAIAKLDVVRRARPMDRVCLMTWHYDWTWPRDTWLLGYGKGWYRVNGKQRTYWRAAA